MCAWASSKGTVVLPTYALTAPPVPPAAGVVKVPVVSVELNSTPLCNSNRGVKVPPEAGATPTSTGLLDVTTLLLTLNVPVVMNSRPLKI